METPREAGARLPRTVRIQTADFDLGAEVAVLRAGDHGIGAVASFIGTVRDRNDGAAVAGMTLEHYPGMTEKAIDAMVDAAAARFPLLGVTVVHRVGPLAPGDQVVLVAVASAHRGAAFQACEFLMDYLKTQAPFWKKEQTPQGGRWVDARVSDDAALARWGIAAGNADGPAAGEPAADGGPGASSAPV
ncbi:molybdopterin synthase catalytic subunit MoaE [Piscinibacter sakaiensis]|uniref:Molybdopterin synthase catalytic subunit n=1 Tax=Piscinibacter sakaiensis TaxID=1547922 RepID=A0A0K8NYR3_PISS1|nr:molybdopterin synthase catalytic subunit MoaE [Piscinibacter sakaiensis]GAP35542.1 molybdenum cofactor biosynthesis protein MoaE [Piscinibacter sakaiensis]